MKGTLFSADFIEDINGNLRLLEVNTDTQASSTNLQFFDYTDFISVLQSNNITKVTVVNKPHIHKDLVTHISESLNSNAPFITSFSTIDEGPNVIYPTSVTDESDLFVLRLAYDESAIFDSEYAKGTLNTLKLFTDYNESSSVPEFYHSSSLHGEYNTITAEFNGTNLPDFVVKDVSENHTIASFYKVGSEVSDETNSDRLNSFIQLNKNEDILVEKYHTNSNVLVDNKVSSIRSYSIIYGSDLSLIHLAQYKSYSAFTLPTETIYNPNLYSNKIDNKHYYEFATNIVKYEGVFDGILNTHLIIKADDSEVEAGSLSVGDELKSYYIGNTSLSEGSFDYQNWEITGNAFPSGSFLTSSVVVFKNTKPLSNKTLCNIYITGSDDSLFVAANKSFLVYDNTTNSIKWKMAFDINEETDYLLDYDGSTAQVTSNDLFIVNEDGYSLVEIDVEDTDTYIIAGSTSINSFVTHNAPCFVAGTKITLSNGKLKDIEDVKPGDVVCTFDFTTNEVKENVVNAVFSKRVNQIVEYKFSNGESVKCTLDHPLYVEEKGWCSYNDSLSNELYSLDSKVKLIEKGDVLKLFKGITSISEINLIDEETIVYNLQDISGNHNFFANNVLVHNRFCFVEGTEITLSDGNTKKIEDIEIGDVVLSYNEGTNQNEYNKVTNIYKPIHNDIVEYTLSNGRKIISTFDHPYYVNGLNLASYSPELTINRYESLNNVVGINVGDKLNLVNGDVVDIISIKERDTMDTQTYIFTVENTHNFYANGVLVHNKCFITGTPITMADGSVKPIEQIVVGDSILTFNETTKVNEPGTVGELKKDVVGDIVKLELGLTTEIYCTEEHPFFVKDKGYVNAKDLVVGDVCVDSNFEDTPIKSVQLLEEEHTVYNLLDVSENHNFYAHNILVHNKL